MRLVSRYNSSDFKVEFEKLNSKQLVRKVIRAKSNFKTYQEIVESLTHIKRVQSLSNIRIQKNEDDVLSSPRLVPKNIPNDSIYYYNKLEKNYLVSDYENIENIIKNVINTKGA